MRTLLTAAVVLAGLALVAPDAGGKLLVSRGITDARLGMTQRDLDRRLGAPDSTADQRSTRVLVYVRRRLVVTLLRGRVTLVSTQDARERTARGIGVGSTERQVSGRVRGTRCATRARVRFCRTGSVRRGRRSTTFLMVRGRVATVSIARGR